MKRVCNAWVARTALPLPVNYGARNVEKTMEAPARGWLPSNRMHRLTNGGFFESSARAFGSSTCASSTLSRRHYLHPFVVGSTFKAGPA